MANLKITELTENTSRHFNDLLALVDDPAGTPLTQKIKLINATGVIVNAQTGTTYTYLTGDYGKIVTHTNGSAIAGTLPQAGASFPANWFMLVQNRGAGALTITPTTSTIDGAATLVLNQNEGAIVVSDGTNYFTLRGKATGAAGVGDVVGPASATDNALVRFDSTTGKLIQNSTVTLDDTGAITVPEMAAPGTPAAGKVSLYAKADGLLYSKDDAGLETVVTGGGGGGGSPGGSDNDYQYRIDASTFGGGSLKRIDANTTEIKNSTTTQVFRLYDTDDGAGNYERVALQVASSKYVLASEKGGTGSIQNIGIKIDTALYDFGSLSFTPPTNGGEQLGTTSIRWGQINGSVVNLPNSGEYRFHALTRLTAGVDGFPIIIADAGIGSACGWIFGRNDANGVRLKRNSTVLETKLGADSDYAVHVAAAFRAAERSADPSAADLTSGANAKDRVQMYMKSDKLVFAYNDGAGTVNYLTIPLDGSTTTWTNGTSAP